MWALGAGTRALDLSGNPGLGAVPGELAALTRLTRLTLSGCGLQTEAVDWGALAALGPSLTVLLADRNRLASVPGAALAALGHVTDLTLSHVRLPLHATLCPLYVRSMSDLCPLYVRSMFALCSLYACRRSAARPATSSPRAADAAAACG